MRGHIFLILQIRELRLRGIKIPQEMVELGTLRF